MTLNEAKIDAQERANRTGLYYWVIRFKDNTYETVQGEHLITHKKKYQEGIFKIVGKRIKRKAV